MTAPFEVAGWALEGVPPEATAGWPAQGRLLDVGGGPAGWLSALAQHHPDWQGVGIERSPRVAAATGRHHPAVRGAASALPFRREAFDIVVAARLFHDVAASALPAAAAELARVCAPCGSVVVVVDGPEHWAQLDRLVSEATGVPCSAAAEVLTPDEASRALAPWLDVVATDIRREEIVVTEPAPVMTYLQDLRPSLEPRLRGFVNWTVVLVRARAALAQALAADGEWRCTVDTTVLRSRPRHP